MKSAGIIGHGISRLRCAALTLGAVLLLQNVTAAAAVSIADDRGRTLVLAAPAQRVVTLAPHLAEIAFAAGAGERLAGVARFSDFPEAVRRLPQVGDGSRVDLERIVALKPDLILAWKSGNQASDVARLEQLGFPVFVTEPTRLADIPRLVRAVGVLVGTARAAERASDEFNKQINALREYYGGRAPLRVFYEIWHRPLLTVNGRHIISDVITLCGGRNVFAGAPALTPLVSTEAVLAARPDVILGGGSAGGEEEFAAQWRASAIKALRDLPRFYVDPDEIQRQTPRIVGGARAICEDLEQVRMNRQESKAKTKK
jgi:iron complex transport system substrate-binding protein